MSDRINVAFVRYFNIVRVFNSRNGYLWDLLLGENLCPIEKLFCISNFSQMLVSSTHKMVTFKIHCYG